jgi:hypothetical protein
MKKFMILFVAGVLGAAMLTGCKGGDEGTGTSAPDSTAAPKPADTTSAPTSAPESAPTSAPTSGPAAAPAKAPGDKK